MMHESRRELRAAPELAVLAVAQGALDALVASLCARHGNIERKPPPTRPVIVLRAAQLLESLRALQHDLELYRAAVLRALRPPKLRDDDIAF
jgi:alkylhydroperoxidase family enzyme